MKWLIALPLAALLVMVAAIAFAVGPTLPQEPFTPDGQESAVWYYDINDPNANPNGWVPNPAIINDRLGRLFRAGVAYRDSCNKVWWPFDFTVHASIAQWVVIDMDYTRFDWYIKKPGTYAGDCIEYCIRSNGDVGLAYSGFDDLLPIVAGRNPIPVWYGIEVDGIMPIDDDNLWIRSYDMNDPANAFMLYDDNDAFHYDGICFKLWTKIEVVACNSACEYEDTGTITVTLDNQKPWIAWEAGCWWESIPTIP